VAYDSFFTDPERGLMEVACWAHYPDSDVIQGNGFSARQQPL
jgi:hypothetical protein